MKKSLFIFALIFCVRLLSSCIDPPCGSPGGGFRVIDFHPTLLTKNESGQFVWVDEPRIVHHENLYLEVFIETVSKKNFSSQIGGFSSTYACSIFIKLLDEISSIQITSDTQFQDRQPGEDLSDFFGWSEYAGNNWTPISELSLQWIEFQFYLKLLNAPLEASTHQFTISFDLEDGRSFDVVLDPIEILL